MNNSSRQDFQTTNSNAFKASRSSQPRQYQITWDSVLAVALIWLIWFLFITVIGMLVSMMLKQGYGVTVEAAPYFTSCGILAVFATVPAARAFFRVNS